MKPFLAAIQFLTVIPFPKAFVFQERALGRSVPFFPLIGLLIGLTAAAVGYVVNIFLPPLPAMAMVVIFLLVISGGLHMDGLADTADGFFSARPRDKMLAIMRDSRIGVMGVIAVICVMLIKWSLLLSLTGTLQMAVIVLMPLVGRSAMVITMTCLPYIRTDGGLATLFAVHRSWIHALWAVACMLIAGFLLAQGMGLSIALASLAVTALWTAYSFRKIGGYTGDTLGAVCEIVEIVPALVAVAWNH